MAAAYAEAGDFDSAVRFEQQALAHDKEEDRKGYEYRLSMYEREHPFGPPPRDKLDDQKVSL